MTYTTHLGVCSMLCLAPLLFGSASAEPSQRVLHGTVSDTSHNILPGTAVSVNGTEVRAVTDVNGQFSLTSVPNGPGKLVLSKDGYHSKTVSFPAEAGKLDIMMEPLIDDKGLLRYTVQISMSHAVGSIKHKEKRFTDELYREEMKQSREKPTEESVFRIYLPRDCEKVLGVFLISEHGVGGPMMEHKLLRGFADRYRLALVGVLGNPIQRGIYPASALDAILADIGTKAGHPEIATVPAFTFGHSNGTGFSAAYAAMRPDRVIGWISFHSGASWHLVFAGVEDVPGLTMHGNKDKFFKNGQQETIQKLRRERNAPISLLVDGKSGHWPRNREATFSLIIAFCESCMRTRLPDGVLTGEAKLKPVSIEAGWLASLYDRDAGGMQKPTIAPYAEFTGDRATANWLPDETFAKVWQHYAATGLPGAPHKP